MLKHAGMLEPQDPGLLPFDETIDLELRWKEWLRREHNNRYVEHLLPIRSEKCRAVIYRFVQTTISCPLKQIGYDLAQTSSNAPTLV
jgi:hypothetical protein